MEWLNQLTLNPNALGSFLDWLNHAVDDCSKHALDVSIEAIPVLKGERNAYLAIIGYVKNNISPGVLASIHTPTQGD